jgi:hypothetical protein
MKKLLTIAALAGMASLSFGQGYVNTANGTTSKVSAGGAVITAASLANYNFEVLVAPTTTTTISSNSLSSWTDTGDVLVSAGANGRLIPGNNTPDGAGQQIPGYGTTATADFAVVAWSANLGPTYADALAYWNQGAAAQGSPGADAGFTGGSSFSFGISAVAGPDALAPSGGPYNAIFGSGAGFINGLNLSVYQIPEPATFALAGLGAAALVIFRRRK